MTQQHDAAQDRGDGLTAIALSQQPPDQRRALLAHYVEAVYNPAFPDPSLREDPENWLRLIERSPGPPQPLTEVVLLLDPAGRPVGGATVELYRQAGCGLLTYLAVRPERRERGLGRRLVSLARESLTRMAGAAVPMFAETERLEDARTPAQRAEIVTRLRRLSALGGRRVQFDYTMPPLRSDSRTHRLYLLVFDAEGEDVEAGRVAALLDELARALGTTLGAHDATARMADRLATVERLALGDLAPPDRVLRECPFFSPFARASIAYAVEIPQSVIGPSAFRISDVYKVMSRADPRLSDAEQSRARSLFGPTRSFLDDITTGGPGVNGRPLLLAAEAGSDGPIRRPLVVERGPYWDYDFEGTPVFLEIADEERRHLELAYHEHFCLFESGRLLYVIVIGNDPAKSPCLDEYAVIQLQQLAVDPDRTGQETYLGFRAEAEGSSAVSLNRFVRDRLAALSGPSQAEASAVRDVLRLFGIARSVALEPDAPVLPVKNAIVMIEDEALFAAAQHTYEFYRMDAGDSRQPPGSTGGAWAGGEQPAEVVADDEAWRRRFAGKGHHTLDGFGAKRPARTIPRSLKAFAGIAQAIPDFPRVDESELHDSTRPISVAPQNLFYNHPAVQLEVGVQWRTFREAADEIGACPYALLTWLIAAHDELIVSDMEARIERMLLGAVRADVPLAEIGRTHPMRNVDQVMSQMRKLWPSSERLVDSNLEERIDIFRWCSIHQSGNIFRYPTERELLANIGTARGTQQRFAAAHDLLDRYENLIEDVSTLASAHAGRNTNWLLTAITVFGIAQMTSALVSLGMSSGDALWATAGVLVATGCAFALWRRSTQLSRSRKSS
ncbi:MAG: GNAT family N-acetyltransferase [Porphyrobacter sp.]|nr:GNAT family N-acetyltransferase [Porphyrobacter sp.]